MTSVCLYYWYNCFSFGFQMNLWGEKITYVLTYFEIICNYMDIHLLSLHLSRLDSMYEVFW